MNKFCVYEKRLFHTSKFERRTFYTLSVCDSPCAAAISFSSLRGSIVEWGKLYWRRYSLVMNSEQFGGGFPHRLSCMAKLLGCQRGYCNAANLCCGVAIVRSNTQRTISEAFTEQHAFSRAYDTPFKLILVVYRMTRWRFLLCERFL